MGESAPSFNDLKTPTPSPEQLHGVVQQSAGQVEGNRRKEPRHQARLKLSCTKCRERKVRCDRTKPCWACCVRGQPKQCQFSNDYAPVQQSYELRRLRVENLRLKERLRASGISADDEEDDSAASSNAHHGEGPLGIPYRQHSAKQHRFQGEGWTDNLYFGSPGLANVIAEFASINVNPTATCHLANLSHPMPRGVDMYAPGDISSYPFAALFPWSPETCIRELLQCLPERNELLEYLDAFQKRVNVCSFPNVPAEITKSKVELFLSNANKNAEKCPNMLALLFAALALGSQHCVWDKSNQKWVAGAMVEESKRGNIYLAAAMQALRMASFMNRPTLVGIQALIMMGPYLTNSGRFLDAWTLFGTTIRLAQGIGLHRHPKYLPALPSPRECHLRKTLWWWMLHMDQEYSMTLGRPLGISGIGDCPPPCELTTDQTFLRYGEFVHQFTILGRQILSSAQLNTEKIDKFTDSVRMLLDTLPEVLQFDESWLDNAVEIPDWPLNVMSAVFYCKAHSYLILLNRSRLENKTSHSGTHKTTVPARKRSPCSFRSTSNTGSSHPSPTPLAKATLRGRALVISSSEDVLTAFFFFHSRVPAALVCWTVGQQAFNASMILLLDALETGDRTRIGKVEKAYDVFNELKKNGVHKLAKMAVDRVGWGLEELGRRRPEDVASTKLQAVDAVQDHGGESEAGRRQGGMGGSVMDNSGMLLLEDAGLQSFGREELAPFTSSWVMAGGEFDGAGAVPAKQVEEDAPQWEASAPWSGQPPGAQDSAQDSARASAPPRIRDTAPVAACSTTTMQQDDVHVVDMTPATTLDGGLQPPFWHYSHPSLHHHHHMPAPQAPFHRDAIVHRHGREAALQPLILDGPSRGHLEASCGLPLSGLGGHDTGCSMADGYYPLQIMEDGRVSTLDAGYLGDLGR